MTTLANLLEQALEARQPLFDPAHQTAFRVFNGVSEGDPDLSIDLYGSSLVFHNYADDVEHGLSLVREAQDILTKQLPWLRTGLVKIRNGKTQEEKRGQLLFGGEPDHKIQEYGVWYAIDLTMNRDTSFYLDTRDLRRWLRDHLHDKSVLNTFAYTGSLGVAALAGGASRVLHLDLNRRFLNLARASYTLNGFPFQESDFITANFFSAISRLKKVGETFDCVILDPPFFSTTSKGKVDQVKESALLINKVRPLVKDGGTLVAINNALFVSGRKYMQTLEELCNDGYLKIRSQISVPKDIVGYKRVLRPITDPSPFNHSTKIAILDVRRKSASVSEFDNAEERI